MDHILLDPPFSRFCHSVGLSLCPPSPPSPPRPVPSRTAAWWGAPWPSRRTSPPMGGTCTGAPPPRGCNRGPCVRFQGSVQLYRWFRVFLNNPSLSRLSAGPPSPSSRPQVAIGPFVPPPIPPQRGPRLTYRHGSPKGVTLVDWEQESSGPFPATRPPQRVISQGGLEGGGTPPLRQPFGPGGGIVSALRPGPLGSRWETRCPVPGFGPWGTAEGGSAISHPDPGSKMLIYC